MVSALHSGASGPGLSPGWGHCVVFLGKTLYQVYMLQVNLFLRSICSNLGQFVST